MFTRKMPKPSVGQKSLFNIIEFPIVKMIAPGAICNVTAAAKRRDGGTRYWCSVHKADATAKYGKPSNKCCAADEPLLQQKDILDLNLDEYSGGVALWGAVPAVYDTTCLEMDRGIHVHARPKKGSMKEIDFTRPAVRLKSSTLPDHGVLLNEIDAIYYMVTSVFGFDMSYILCSHCKWPHLDKDFFSVHPHHRHLCSGCGRHFHDSKVGIGNPIIGVRQACGVSVHKTTPAKESLNIQQVDYPGGVQVWGSNPAFIWTGEHEEAEGIHIHTYMTNHNKPVIDETYREVTIDGTKLDANTVRVLMAQSVMPSLRNRIKSISCPRCNQPLFECGKAAFTPSLTHNCSNCKLKFTSSGRIRKVVANPLPDILAGLAKKAVRTPQQHILPLRTETL